MAYTFEEIREEIVAEVNKITDPKTGYNFNVDVNDSNDIVAVLINFIATKILEFEEKLLKYRNSLNPFKATGNELRDVITYKNITVKEAYPTTTIVSFSGPNETIIPENTILKNNDESKVFYTIKSVQLNDSGVASVQANCNTVGDVLLDIDELTKIDPTIPNVSIYGNNTVIIGSNAETDDQIKKRMSIFNIMNRMSLYDIIDSKVMSVTGVKNCVTYGYPLHEIEYNYIKTIVIGGNDQDVANAIFENNLFNYLTTGNTTVTVQSAYLNRKSNISFERPQPQLLSIVMTITSITNDYSENINTIIVKKLIESLQSYAPGETIYASNLIVELKDLTSIQIVLLRFTDDKEEEYDKIDIEWDKFASTDASLVKITHS